jgi:phosphorylcholine metabolism protein LicD
VCIMLDDNKIPFYLDCGTLLGCIREGRLLLHDTDVDVTIHLSKWENLIDIDYTKYGLVLKRKYKQYPYYPTGNLISVYLENESAEYYCDIYANPAFPILIAAQMGDNLYPVPKDPGLYLKQLYGNWMVPSNTTAGTEYHRNNGLIFSEYRNNWDLKYNIYKCKF